VEVRRTEEGVGEDFRCWLGGWPPGWTGALAFPLVSVFGSCWRGCRGVIVIYMVFGGGSSLVLC